MSPGWYAIRIGGMTNDPESYADNVIFLPSVTHRRLPWLQGIKANDLKNAKVSSSGSMRRSPNRHASPAPSGSASSRYICVQVDGRRDRDFLAECKRSVNCKQEKNGAEMRQQTLRLNSHYVPTESLHNCYNRCSRSLKKSTSGLIYGI